MKIVIDARFWGPKHTGLGVYTANLIANLASLDQTSKYVLLVRKDIGNIPLLPKNFQFKIVDVPAYSIAEQIVLPLVLYQLQPDVVHFPSINVPILYFRKYVVTIHDLIKHDSRGPASTTRSELVYWPKYFVYLFVNWWVTVLASKIIVPSVDVKNKLAQKYPVTKSKTIVTYEAPDLINLKDNQPNKPENYALYVGNAYPHKNLEFLISAWGKIYDQTATILKIVSSRSVFTQRLREVIVKSNASRYVLLLDFVSDQELLSLFKKSRLYVFPTLMEGFGLPGLNALLLGIPLVCSDIPVLREIYGPAACYFNPHDQTNLTSKIVQLQKDPSLQKRMITEGYKQVKKYSWSKMARETLKVYEDCTRL